MGSALSIMAAKSDGHGSLEKHVARGDGKRGAAQPPRERGGERERIEMARVIRDHDEWRAFRQVFAARDAQPMIRAQITGGDASPRRLLERADKAGFASQAAKAVGGLEAEVAGGGGIASRRSCGGSAS